MTRGPRRLSPVDGRPISEADERDLNLAFSRAFSGRPGEQILSYLANLTGTVLPMGTSSEDLQYAEGRRALFAIINQRIDDGRNRRPHVPAPGNDKPAAGS